MANVKFYRLGLINPVSYAFYESYKQEGNLVFANVKDENNIAHQYIWANGIEYHVDLQAVDFLSLVDNNQSNVKVDSSDGKLTFNADLDISGEMINVVEWEGQYYDERDTEHTEPLSDPTIIEHGADKYLKLKLGEDNVYIWSKDLVSLDNYFTKDEVNASLNRLENDLTDYINDSIADISTKIGDLQDYVDQKDEELNGRIANVSDALNEYMAATGEKFDEVDASINKIEEDLDNQQDIIDEIGNKVADLSTAVDEINEKIDADEEDLARLHVDVSTLQDEVEDISIKLADGIVSSVDSSTDFVNITPNHGDVKINLDLIKATDDSSFQSHGLVTDGYVEEKLAWINVEE